MGLTASEVHGAVERAVAARLAVKDAGGKPSVVFAALWPFVQHGARYSFPAIRGTLTRGVPTGYAAAPLRDSILPGGDPPPVWPHRSGTARGVAIHPLYPSVPEGDITVNASGYALYELLALFDAVRDGSARERSLALKLLEERLRPSETRAR